MENKIDKCFLVLSVASAFAIFGACSMFNSYASIPDEHKETAGKVEHVREPVYFYEKPMWWLFEEHRRLMYMMDRVSIYITRKRVVLYDEYKMFITAYCAEECGWSYMTSSGETCHRSDWNDRYEPTTCAIDRAYFGYGTLFYIPSEDRVYIAEDTGSGVKGYWIDTYQDYMSDVVYYNTRYEVCYTCEVEEYSEQLCMNVRSRDVIERAWEERNDFSNFSN